MIVIFNILFQNTDFVKAVPTNLIKHAFRKMFQFYDKTLADVST